jgi:signal transduction histidine kinase
LAGHREYVQLRAELATRDRFLCRLAGIFSASIGGLARATRVASKLSAPVRSALVDLQGLARELQIIASPREPVQLRLRKRELCGLLARFCEERKARVFAGGLTLRFARAGAISCRVDADLLATMLDELLSNALKYRRKRPVSLHAEQSGKTLSISVTNYGPWLGPKPVYKRFRRGESRRAVQGFGVGLWLTRRLAVAHGGRFSISSDRAQTRAIIRLPAAASGKRSWFRATISD